MSRPLKEEPFTIFAITTFIAAVFAAGHWVGRAGAEPPPCPAYETAPMRFCEVIGSPVGGRIAIMPDIVVSTDP